MNNALKELYRIISVIICLTLIASIPTAYAYDKPWENDELLEKQTTLSTLNAVELWEKLAENGKSPAENVVVAVLDTGISLSDDIEQNLWTNEKELNGIEGVDDDGNGYVDDIHGMSLTDTPATVDTSGHGTMMSGIIAMTAGNGGGVGIAYSAKIMSVKISKTKAFPIDDIVEAIYYAADNGADVINMSLGTIYPTNELEQAIKYASQRSILVAAAGNEKTYADDHIYQSKVYPAAYPEVIGVMATENDGTMADFTNWCTSSENPIYEIAAPGRDVMTTYLNSDHRSTYGTSPAVAEVSSALAILKGLLPDKTPDELQKILLDNTERRTVYNVERGGEHKFLNVPDVWTAYQKTIEEEKSQPTQPREETQPATENQERKKSPSIKIKKGEILTAGSGKTRAKYLVKTSRTVYYNKCLTAKLSKTATVPKQVTLKNGKKYAVTGISSKAFSDRKKVKTITIKTKKLKKSTVKNSLKASGVKTVKIKVGDKKQNKIFKAKYRAYFPQKKISLK